MLLVQGVWTGNAAVTITAIDSFDNIQSAGQYGEIVECAINPVLMVEAGYGTVVPSGEKEADVDAQREARKEMEDLLKAIREQQRSGELDRQMRQQLEKAHTRIEELEKKLLDFSNQALRRDQNNVAETGILQHKTQKVLEGIVESINDFKEKWAGWRDEASASDGALRREMLERLADQEEKQAEWQKKNFAVQQENMASQQEMMERFAKQEEKQAEWQKKSFAVQQENMASQQEIMARFADSIDSLKEKRSQWQEKASAFQREMVEHFSSQDEKLAKWQEGLEDVNKCMREVKETVFAWMEAGGVSEVLEERLLRLEKAISEGEDMQPPLVSLPRQISALRMWISDIRKELKERD